MFRSVLAVLVAGNLAMASPMPQGPNTLAQYNPTVRTMSVNQTWWILPLSSATVASLVAPKKLIPIAPDTSKYPNGWPAGTHPVVLAVGWGTHIEQLGLEIPQGLMGGSIRVPCVDELGDGKTCFQMSVSDYIGGDNDNKDNAQPDPGVVPAAVGSLEGTTLRVGDFIPGTRPYDQIGANEYVVQVNHLIAPNPISGPSLAPQAYSFDFGKIDASKSFVTAKGFHDFISQTVILNNGLCSNIPYYFNETFADPFFANGKVTLFPYLSGLNGVPDSIGGTFANGTGYSATAETIGFNPQPCAQAVAANDPKAQE